MLARLLFLVLLFALLIAGCGAPSAAPANPTAAPAANPAPAFPVTITDDSGQEVVIAIEQEKWDLALP